MKKKTIVNVNSTKGGVGKTTLALAIALERIRTTGQDETVVLLDVDIFGTEVADALEPFRGRGEDRWGLAILDVLVGSTGGNVTVGQHLVQRLRDETLELPRLRPHGLNRGRLVVVPSLPWREASDRQRALHGDDGGRRLDASLVADTLAHLQAKVRLTALLDAVLRVYKPHLVVLDQAPFHFPLSQVPKLWEKPAELGALLPDPAAQRRLEGYDIRHLEVLGPEEQDLYPLMGLFADPIERRKAHQAGRRWVLNRCPHSSGAADAKACSTARAFPALQPWPELGHVPLSGRLLLGLAGRGITGIHFGGESVDLEFSFSEGPPMDYAALLAKTAEAQQLDPRAWNGTIYVRQSWADFLAGATP